MGLPLEKLLHEVGDLPPMPVVAQRVMELCGNERTSADQLGKVIGNDQGLATRILKMANSALYGTPQGVETVNQAIVRLGFQTTERIVIQASVQQIMRVVDDLDRYLWNHSITVAISAHVVARVSRTALADEALTAGLLHDVGKTIIKLRHPSRYGMVAAEARTTGNWTQPEWDMFGYEHTEVGALVMACWKLSRRLTMVAQYHHHTALLDSGDVGRARREVAGMDASTARLVAVVAMADDIAHRLAGAAWLERNTPPIHDTKAARFLGISEEDAEKMMEQIRSSVGEEFRSFV